MTRRIPAAAAVLAAVMLSGALPGAAAGADAVAKPKAEKAKADTSYAGANGRKNR